MTEKNSTKKAARELQRLGGGAVSYQACRNLLLAHGFEGAKERVLEMAKSGDVELAALRGRSS